MENLVEYRRTLFTDNGETSIMLARRLRQKERMLSELTEEIERIFQNLWHHFNQEEVLMLPPKVTMKS